MGRHAKEDDSPLLTLSAVSNTTSVLPRHRAQSGHRRFSLTALFRRSRHLPGVVQRHSRPNELGHHGVDSGWLGTLQGLNAVTQPGLKPVAPPAPSRLARRLTPIPALMTSVHPTPLDLPPLIDAPTHYQRLIRLVPGT